MLEPPLIINMTVPYSRHWIELCFSTTSQSFCFVFQVSSSIMKHETLGKQTDHLGRKPHFLKTWYCTGIWMCVFLFNLWWRTRVESAPYLYSPDGPTSKGDGLGSPCLRQLFFIRSFNQRRWAEDNHCCQKATFESVG